MSHHYTTKVTAVGGRNGIVKSDDGILDLPLAMPKELAARVARPILNSFSPPVMPLALKTRSST